METKLYKFNMAKYGHDIELAYNIYRNAVDEDNATDNDWDNFEKVQDIYGKLLSSNTGRFALVPYEIWRKSMDIVMWAEAHRDAANGGR